MVHVKETPSADQARATGIAAFFLGIGLAGEPFDWMGALFAALLMAVFTVALERRARTLQIFIIAFFGVIITSMVQHATLGQLIGHPMRAAAPAVARQLYFGLYPGSIVVALGLGLLATASLGHKRAPLAIAIIGSLVGVALFFLL